MFTLWKKKKKKKVVKRRESGGGKEQCSFCVLCNPGPGRKKQPKRTSDKSGYQWQQHWWARHRPLIFFLHIHLSLPKPFILTSLTYICSASWRPLHLSPPVFILTTLSTLKHPPHHHHHLPPSSYQSEADSLSCGVAPPQQQ